MNVLANGSVCRYILGLQVFAVVVSIAAVPAMLALAERIFDFETRSALDDVARVARPGRVTFAGDRYVPVLKYFFKLAFRIQFHD
jgi:hypothetical protein